MLEASGVAERLAAHGQPIHRIEVRDGLQRDPLAFADERPLGTMVGLYESALALTLNRFEFDLQWFARNSTFSRTPAGAGSRPRRTPWT